MLKVEILQDSEREREMGDDERRALLPRSTSRSEYQAIGVSPGGYSWHRKISEHGSGRSQEGNLGFLPVGDLGQRSNDRR